MKLPKMISDSTVTTYTLHYPTGRVRQGESASPCAVVPALLYIATTDDAYNTSVRAALNALAGNTVNALTYTETGSLWWKKIQVGLGAGAVAAAAIAPHGMGLLTRIIQNNNSVYIYPGNVNRAAPQQRYLGLESAVDAMNRASTPGNGSDADVYIDATTLNGQEQTTTYDANTGQAQRQNTPDAVIIGHELIHADRFTKGRGGFDNQGHLILGSYLRASTNRDQALVEEEIYTVGLTPSGNTIVNPDPSSTTEQQIRAEHNQLPRDNYP